MSLSKAAREQRESRLRHTPPTCPIWRWRWFPLSQTLAEARRKATVYLRHGTVMVWLIDPGRNRAESWTAADDGTAKSEIISLDGELSGGAVLPGFALPLNRLFSL